ncbi:MAG: hypothetical protein HC915_14755 [Anaerolineae bacterium]|nr:hypothetical protein [Anaerolineae bacterium]
MGAYLQALPLSEVQTFFAEDDLGYLTEAGHARWAAAMAACFYEAEPTPGCSER